LSRCAFVQKIAKLIQKTQVEPMMRIVAKFDCTRQAVATFNAAARRGGDPFDGLEEEGANSERT
jgi:hypothetical protein